MKNLIKIFMMILIFQNLPAQNIKVIAHRGASSLAPENTMAAFKKGIEIGSDFIELDIWNSNDDSLMVIHDNTIDRTTNGTGTVRSQTFTQLRRWDAGLWFAPEFAGEKIPTLYEVMTLVKEKNSIACVEIKNTQITKNVYDLIKKMNLIDRVYFFCFNFDALKEIRLKDSTAKIVYLVDNVDSAKILKLKSINGNVIGSGGSNTQELINFSHNQGLEFWVWTVDDSVAMKSYVNKRVNAIITNYPQRLIKILSKAGKTYNLIPEKLKFLNFPNPFNNTTNFYVEIPE